LVLLLSLVIHLGGYLACLREPRFFDLWMTKLAQCPRGRNHAYWRCNSYCP
jgi:type IV secretion system protein VirB3